MIVAVLGECTRSATGSRGSPGGPSAGKHTGVPTAVTKGPAVVGYTARIAGAPPLLRVRIDRDAMLDASGDALSVLELPSLRRALRHSLPTLFEGVAAPFGVFYLVLLVSGIKGACLAGLGCSFLALGRRLLYRQRVPATLVLGSLPLSFRTAVTMVTGSAFFYFAQPTAGTALLALVLLASAMMRRPFIERLAHDFCPLEPTMLRRPAVRRFFIQISLLWAFVLLGNAGCVMWLLLTASLRAFVLERVLVTAVLTGGAIVVSVMWFVRAMRRERILVRFSGTLRPLRASHSSE